MAVRTLPPFRADHVGSLLRPPDLLAARARHQAGELDDDGLRQVEDSAIRNVVALQREAGVRTATDGEFRRTSWHMDFIYQLEGVDPTDQKLAVHFRNKSGNLDFESAALSVHDRIGLGHTIFGHAFEFLQTVVDGDQVPKLTIPSPNMVHYRGGRAAIDESVYPDLEPFWADLAAAYAEQVRRVAELGCTYLQLDDTSLAYLNDPEQRALVAAQGGDPDHLHEQYVKNVNAAIAGRPDSLRVTTPSTTCLPSGTNRSGPKPPDRSSSYSRKKPSTSSWLNSTSATKSYEPEAAHDDRKLPRHMWVVTASPAGRPASAALICLM
jgi:5-methyltetrahydropteroyltriglutamate--homocysteine methyltransferase